MTSRETGAAAPLASALPRLWLFNLDAELELSRPPGPYQTPARVLRALGPLLERARALMGPGDRAIGDAGPAPTARQLGACWSPTPSALHQLARAGAEIGPTPAEPVLRRVCHRRFYVELGGGAPGATYVQDEVELARVLVDARAGAWLFKRAYGFAGRGQRRIQIPSADDRRWLCDSLARGGLIAEPWLTLEQELTQHGFIEMSGRVQLGELCVQQTDRYRAWVDTRRAGAGELASAWAAALSDRLERAGEALFQAGYFGPFGIDAYVYRSASGGLAFNAFGELNARYTMGFPVGFGPAPRCG